MPIHYVLQVRYTGYVWLYGLILERINGKTWEQNHRKYTLWLSRTSSKKGHDRTWFLFSYQQRWLLRRTVSTSRPLVCTFSLSLSDLRGSRNIPFSLGVQIREGLTWLSFFSSRLVVYEQQVLQCDQLALAWIVWCSRVYIGNRWISRELKASNHQWKSTCRNTSKIIVDQKSYRFCGVLPYGRNKS